MSRRGELQRWSVLAAMASISLGCVEHAPLPEVNDAGAPDAYVAPISDAGAMDPPDVGTAVSDGGPPIRCDGPPGLYASGSCSELAPGVRRFAPRYVLWSDAATKERFVLLPPGGRIDTSNPNGWVFPMGTKLWKTFSRDGVRLETRMLEKQGFAPGVASWRMRVFVWNAAQNAVREETRGVSNVLGTTHDVPPTSFCPRCHAGAAADVSLGISAIQLNHDGSDVTLAGLAAEGRFSAPVDVDAAVIPGAEVDRDALGYLHANCGHCHGGSSPAANMRLWIDVGARTMYQTTAYRSTVGVASGWMVSGASTRVVAGNPEASTLVRRMSLRGGETSGQMPPIATEVVDPTGLTHLRTWITSLAP